LNKKTMKDERIFMKKITISKRSTIKSLTICASALVLALSSGCTALWISGIVGATGAAVAGTAFVEGRLTTTIKAKPDQIKAATEKAFKKLNISVVSSTANALDADIKGKYADGPRVTVSSSLKEDGQSKLGIRVGTFGDQDKSLKLYAAISEELDKVTKPAAAEKDAKTDKK
jgi:hypothetical protein